MSRFSPRLRHILGTPRHVLVGEGAVGGLRRRGRPTPGPASGPAPVAGGAGDEDRTAIPDSPDSTLLDTSEQNDVNEQNELDIEKKWCLLARLDHEHLGHFFDKYHGPLLSYIQRSVGNHDIAEDLLSETFLEAVDGFWRFRFKGVTFGAWLFRLAKRRIAKHFARQRRRREVVFNEDVHDVAVPAVIGAALEKEQDEQLLALCLQHLDDGNRDLMVLRHWGGLTFAQVAVVLDEDVEKVRSRYYRARKRMASLLSGPAIRERLTREGCQALDQLRLELGNLRVVSERGDESEEGRP